MIAAWILLAQLLALALLLPILKVGKEGDK